MRCSMTVVRKSISKYTGKLHSRRSRCTGHATKFFRVHYGSLKGFHDNGKFDDVFGFCGQHSDMNNPSKWIYEGFWKANVIRLRGPIDSVMVCDSADFKENKVDKYRADLKKRLLNMMNQKNMAKFEEDWEEIFQEVLQEFCVSRVLNG